MIVTVTLNPAIDLTYTVPALRLGESNRVKNPAARAGGKGVNVARVLTSQDAPALVIAPVGGSTGEQFRADLDAAGIAHHLVEVTAPTRRTVAVVTSEHTTNLNEAGNALAAEQWEELIGTVADALTDASVLVLSGSTPPQTPLDLLPQLIGEASRRGIPVVADTSGEHLLAAATAGPTVLKPNRDELLSALRREPTGPTGLTTGNPNIDHVADAARVLADRGGATVFASLGAEGMLAVGPDAEMSYARLQRTLAGNPTGAGDAAVAAIAADLAGGAYDPPATLKRATAWSAAAVLAPLAGTLADPAPLLGAITVTTSEDS